MNVLEPTRSPLGATREREVECAICRTGTFNFGRLCNACLPVVCACGREARRANPTCSECAR